MTDHEGVSVAEYHAMMAANMTEARFQAAVIGAARRAGWMVYHTFDSRRSTSGYPDLHLVHPARGLSMMRELKTEKGKLTPAQVEWIRALQNASLDADVWRPAAWFDGTITRQLETADRR